MKRVIALLIAAVMLCALMCACGSENTEVNETVAPTAVPEIQYSSQAYTHVFNWFISDDATDFRTEKVTVNGEEFDVKIYGKDDDFILMTESGFLYHKNSAAYPETTADTIKEIRIMPSDDSRVDKDQQKDLENFLDLLKRDDWSDKQPENMRFLYSYYIDYKDYPAYIKAGAFVGSGAQYYFRFDGLGSEVYVNPHYYAVDAKFIA